MRDDDFEWDDVKAASNFAKHGVSFEQARLALGDPSPLVGHVDQNSGEDRFTILGMSGAILLHVTYTHREDRFRIISARKANRNDRKAYHEGG